MNKRYIDLVSIKLVKEECRDYAAEPLHNPAIAYDVLKGYFAELDREHFVVVCLNSKNEPTSINTVAIGTLDSAVVHPREVFKSAILGNASSVLLCHNHPSGSIEPSKADIKLTEALLRCGEILGIDVVDHLIFGSTYNSMRSTTTLW